MDDEEPKDITIDCDNEFLNAVPSAQYYIPMLLLRSQIECLRFFVFSKIRNIFRIFRKIIFRFFYTVAKIRFSTYMKVCAK
jgi:hypothetical protein